MSLVTAVLLMMLLVMMVLSVFSVLLVAVALSVVLVEVRLRFWSSNFLLLWLLALLLLFLVDGWLNFASLRICLSLDWLWCWSRCRLLLLWLRLWLWLGLLLISLLGGLFDFLLLLLLIFLLGFHRVAPEFLGLLAHPELVVRGVAAAPGGAISFSLIRIFKIFTRFNFPVLLVFREGFSLILLRVDDVLVVGHGVGVRIFGDGVSVLLLLFRELAAAGAADWVVSMVHLCHGFETNRSDRNRRWSHRFVSQHVVVDPRHNPLAILILFWSPGALGFFLVLQVLVSAQDIGIDAEVWHKIRNDLRRLLADVRFFPWCLLQSWWPVLELRGRDAGGAGEEEADGQVLVFIYHYYYIFININLI